MLGQSVAVLDEQFVRLFGQIDVGATAALSFARQLNMVPIGVIAQAAGVAAFPFLARLAAGGDLEELSRTTGRAARNTVFAAAAAMAALVVLARPLVSMLYQHGEFTAADGSLVARLLVLYAFSIPAWGLHQILSRHFYAKRMMWRVVLIGTAGTLIAIPVWLGLYSAMGVEGFALASTLIMTAYALALLVAWGLDSGWSPVKALVPSILRGLLAAGVAAAVAYPIVSLMFAAEFIELWEAIAAVALGGLTTIAVFLGVSYLLRAPELRDLLRRG
jgi:putative peptidoglycan lipid II flippase